MLTLIQGTGVVNRLADTTGLTFALSKLRVELLDLGVIQEVVLCRIPRRIRSNLGIPANHGVGQGSDKSFTPENKYRLQTLKHL